MERVGRKLEEYLFTNYMLEIDYIGTGFKLFWQWRQAMLS